MKYHSQNLNERGGKTVGSMMWHGRSWLKTDKYREILHTEWLMGKHARDFAAYVEIGNGENNNALMLHVCIPLIFSVYLAIGGVKYCKQAHKTGVAIHNGGLWLYPFTNEDNHEESDPWYTRNFCWYFPWDLKHHLTEIMTHDAPAVAVPVWNSKGRKFMESYPERQVAEKSVSVEYPYAYVLKSGKVQSRTATVYVDRMTWRARWWPIIWREKIRTSISVSFDGEVGEKSGSWKGGCVGCGYDMRRHETPLQCLRRMERERKF